MKYNDIRKIYWSNKLDKIENNIIDIFYKKNLIPMGSASFVLKYKDFWRKNNDLDFVATDFKYRSNKWLEDDKNFKIIFQNAAALRMTYMSKYKIELMNCKIIPSKFYKVKNNKAIINKYWLLSMKIHQLLKLLTTSRNIDQRWKEKISNTEKDIAFLLAKEKFINSKIVDSFKYLLISNSFFYNFIPLDKFDINDESKNKIIYEYLNNTDYFAENGIVCVAFLINKIFNKLKNDYWICKLIKAINLTVYEGGANHKYVDNLDLTDVKNEALFGMDKKINTETEKKLFFDTLLSKKSLFPAIDKYLSMIKNNDKNSFDIRQLILSEIDRILYER
ncbi:hypothetical protein NPA07_05210 [Mycoplasmopsis caviae]|nr:hypothetical protein [Mycoplasmopsis caviae]UUD35173.1 hypothetical protein NPA07_05210 [Mycoplasmopsis caviae]